MTSAEALGSCRGHPDPSAHKGDVLSDNIASGVLETHEISRGRCRGRSEDDLENRASLYSQFLSSGLGQPSWSRYSDFSGTPMSLKFEQICLLSQEYKTTCITHVLAWGSHWPNTSEAHFGVAFRLFPLSVELCSELYVDKDGMIIVSALLSGVCD